VVQINPMSWFVESMHQVMYQLIAPPAWQVGGLLVLGFVVFWVGLVIFDRTSEDIGELL